MDDTEGRGAYWRIRFEGGTELIHSVLHQGDQGRDHVKREPIIGQGGKKVEEGRGMSV